MSLLDKAKRIHWPKLEEVPSATTSQLEEWIKDLPDPDTEEHTLVKEAITDEFIDRIR